MSESDGIITAGEISAGMSSLGGISGLYTFRDNAHAAAEFRVCDYARQELERRADRTDSGWLRSHAVPIMNTAVGITIIGTNWRPARTQ